MGIVFEREFIEWKCALVRTVDMRIMDPHDLSSKFEFLPSGIDQAFGKTDCWQRFRCTRIPSTLYTTGQVDGVNADISELLTTFGDRQSEIIAYIEQLRVTANATWTGNDVLYGPNNGQVDSFAAYLDERFNAALIHHLMRFIT